MNCCKELTISIGPSTGGCFDWSTLSWNNQGDYDLALMNGAIGSISPITGTSATLSMALDSGPNNTGQAVGSNGAWFTHPNEFCVHNLKITVAAMDVVVPSDEFHVELAAFNFSPGYVGGAGLATTNYSGSGSGLTVNATTGAGFITAISVASGGTGYAVNDKFAVVDASGSGTVCTVTSVLAGVVTGVDVMEPSATGSLIIDVHLLSVGEHNFPFCFPVRTSSEEDLAFVFGDVFHPVAGNRDQGSFTIELSNVP